LSNNRFQENTVSTVGIDFVNIFYKIDNVRVKLQIWDTAGQERFRTITKSYFRNVKAIILAFDLTEKESFEKLEYWLWSFTGEQLSSSVVYLIGNKLDLLSDREVTYAEANKVSRV
jgi:small GTP-binding protein